MHFTRPPQRLHRFMPSPRPVAQLSPAIATDLDRVAADADVDESERGVMARILACDRIAWEAAERCAALRREQAALLRTQVGNGTHGLPPSTHAELLDGILRAQLERNRERLENAELSYRSATQLLRDTITDALARRMAPDCLARRIEALDETEAGSSAAR